MIDVDSLAGAGFGGAGNGLANVGHWRKLHGADACLQHDLEFERADGQSIARLKFPFAGNAFVVDIGAVLAAEVANGDIALFHQDHAVVTADHLTRRSKLAIFSTANEELAAGNSQFLAYAFAFEN